MNLYRVGDTLPALRINVQDGGVSIPLTGLDVYVRWQKPDGSEIPERQATDIDTANGICQYVWQVGDLDLVGIYSAIFQLAPESDATQRSSLTNPPLVQIEVLSNDFAGLDNNYPMLPLITPNDVALVLGTDISQLDGNRLLYAIQRGRMLTYVFGEFWKCPGLTLDPQGIIVASQLEAALAAREYQSNPAITFSPIKKETIGSYSYEMREGNVTSSKQQTGGVTGIPDIDAMIGYLKWLTYGCGQSTDIDIAYPDWRQPLTTAILDPSLPLQ